MPNYMAQLRAHPLQDVEMSIRAHSVLRNAGFTTLGDIMDLTKTQFLALPKAGVKTWRELSELRESLEYDEEEYVKTSYLVAAQSRIVLLEASLRWYENHVADCRKLGHEGDVARAKLDRDGGNKAREALKVVP